MAVGIVGVVAISALNDEEGGVPAVSATTSSTASTITTATAPPSASDPGAALTTWVDLVDRNCEPAAERALGYVGPLFAATEGMPSDDDDAAAVVEEIAAQIQADVDLSKPFPTLTEAREIAVAAFAPYEDALQHLQTTADLVGSGQRAAAREELIKSFQDIWLANDRLAELGAENCANPESG